MLALGDMNDDPWDRSLTINARATRERGDVERATAVLDPRRDTRQQCIDIARGLKVAVERDTRQGVQVIVKAASVKSRRYTA